MAKLSKAEEERKRRIMHNLQCTEEEAEDVMKWDKVIDQGGRTPYDLDPETEKMAKKSMPSKSVPGNFLSNREFMKAENLYLKQVTF
jgi:hypothetical protein